MEEIDETQRANEIPYLRISPQNTGVQNRQNFNLEKKESLNPNNFLLHLRLLLRKNFLVQKRSLKSLLIQLLSPIVICIIVYILQVSANSVVGQAVEEPPIHSIGKIPQCYFSEENPSNCSSITYAIVVSFFTLIYYEFDCLRTENV